MNALNNGTLGPTVDHSPERVWKGRSALCCMGFARKRCLFPALSEADRAVSEQLASGRCLGNLNASNRIRTG
jgi:hypothetical protein